jgi:hypothetical protein
MNSRVILTYTPPIFNTAPTNEPKYRIVITQSGSLLFEYADKDALGNDAWISTSSLSTKILEKIIKKCPEGELYE